MCKLNVLSPDFLYIMSLSIMSLKSATTMHMMLSPAWSLASLVKCPCSAVKVFRLLLLISISIVLQGLSSTLNLNLCHKCISASIINNYILSHLAFSTVFRTLPRGSTRAGAGVSCPESFSPTSLILLRTAVRLVLTVFTLTAFLPLSSTQTASAWPCCCLRRPSLRSGTLTRSPGCRGEYICGE